MKLDFNFDAKTKLKHWWTQVKSNFNEIESEINTLENKGIVTDYIADKAVTSQKIADNAITRNQLLDGSVTSSKLFNSAVTADKIGYGAVTSGKIADGAVTSPKLAALAVTTEKLSLDLKSQLDKKLKRAEVASLPSSSLFYDFSDGVSRFTPRSKAVASIEYDENTGNTYQSISVASGNMGSNDNACAVLDFSSCTQGAQEITVEFDCNIESNGRIHLSLCDLETRAALSSVRYESSGVAIEISSSSGNRFQINSSGRAHASFFGQWLHYRIDFDMSARSFKYTITNIQNPADTITGSDYFKGTDCERVTGIELYTWVQTDVVYIDNISVTARADVDESSIYIVSDDGGYREYIYVDGKPVELGNRQEKAIAAEKSARAALAILLENSIVLNMLPKNQDIIKAACGIQEGEEFFIYNNMPDKVKNFGYSTSDITGIENSEVRLNMSENMKAYGIYRCVCTSRSELSTKISLDCEVLENTGEYRGA